MSYSIKLKSEVGFNEGIESASRPESAFELEREREL